MTFCLQLLSVEAARHSKDGFALTEILSMGYNIIVDQTNHLVAVPLEWRTVSPGIALQKLQTRPARKSLSKSLLYANARGRLPIACPRRQTTLGPTLCQL